MKHEEIEVQELDDRELELENRIRNLLWTVSGDYSQQMKPDVALYRRSKAIALYDGVKQGALARFFERDLLGLYMIKKLYLGAEEKALTTLAQLCLEEAIGERIRMERPGLRDMQRQAMEDILEQEYTEMPSPEDYVGQLRVTALHNRLDELDQRKPGKYGGFLGECLAILKRAGEAKETMELLAVIDGLYNRMADRSFERRYGGLKEVLSVTLEELSELDWKDYLSEEMYEEALENYARQLAANMASMEDFQVTQDMEEKREKKKKILLIPPEALAKAHTYVELNYGSTYLTEAEEKRINALLCRGIHSDCSLYFTEGILKNPVKRNYQYEYAIRLRNKNKRLYHDKHRIVKQNIQVLTDMLRKSLVIRRESQELLSDRGSIVPSRVWRVGRSREATIFRRVQKGDDVDFVVDVLIDASGSQQSRQGEVALQAYIISEALSNVQIPHRVMSYCTFWDYTILHRFREYQDDRSANENIFDYVTSSNNRDGLAIKAAGHGLLSQPQEKKILIILSDGRPYDVVVNRPNARNPQPYHGAYAVKDTAGEIRRLRNLGVSVLGVFAGEEKDLLTEKKIFGKDFAYIRDIGGFSRIVGQYLTKQLDADA